MMRDEVMKNILLVEDEDALTNIVGFALRDEGYGVKRPQSAEEALRLCGSHKPDLIICDVKMGDMDGFTLLRELKKNETLKNIPFIFLTAFDGSEDRKKGLRLGADSYITKPFDLDVLLDNVRKFVPLENRANE